MVTLKTLDSSIVSFIILWIIFLHAYNRIERILPQYRLFITMVILDMMMVVVDILGWVFNGYSGLLNYICNVGFNLILFILAPLIPSVWVLYTYYFVYKESRKINKIRTALILMLIANACATVASLYTGWFFHVDSANVYHRGPFLSAHVLYCEALLGYSFVFMFFKRKQFQKRQYRSIMLFFVPPIVGSVIQYIHYGVSYNWVGIMISLLIIYLNLQSRDLNTDYLTGVNNRQYFQRYLKAKIQNSSEKKTFGAIMIDIDHFKKINDNFGHVAGDQALKDAVQILKNSLRRDDFIARFGGDEFLIVVDVQSMKILEDTVRRIKEKTGLFNDQQSKPYTLSFSLGYDIYDVKTNMKPDDFLNHLDGLMYADKRRELKTDRDSDASKHNG
ncbi:MAG: diguanylate cyclase [Lawsonibacter sp.]